MDHPCMRSVSVTKRPGLARLTALATASFWFLRIQHPIMPFLKTGERASVRVALREEAIPFLSPEILIPIFFPTPWATRMVLSFA